MREKFEAWWMAREGAKERNLARGSNAYYNPSVQWAWEGFKAAWRCVKYKGKPVP